MGQCMSTENGAVKGDAGGGAGNGKANGKQEPVQEQSIEDSLAGIYKVKVLLGSGEVYLQHQHLHQALPWPHLQLRV